jgi:molybdate transport system ATP-binding protein
MVAGLTPPDGGSIVVDGEIWFDATGKIDLPSQQRRIGFVFQDYALFPHMTVRENLAYALDGKGERGVIDELLALIRMEELAERRPATLSGGQRQRVALARALARRPKLLLLDEPLSALDTDMRVRLQEDLIALHRRFGVTTILVSHDMAEVFKLSDRAAVIEGGGVKRIGRPAEIFTEGKISGKFKFSGDIVAIERADMVYIITILIGNNMVKVIATEEERAQFAVGERVVVASKAFNPIIMKS